MASSSKPKILLIGEIEQYIPSPPLISPFPQTVTSNPSIDAASSQEARDAWSSLSSIAEPITTQSKTREDFLKECRSGSFNGVTAAYRTFSSVSITGKIEGEVSEELGKAGLKFLAHNGRCTSRDEIIIIRY